MPRAGIEPARGYPRGILSPLRLPIPPPRQPFLTMVYRFLLGSKYNCCITFRITPCVCVCILPDALLDELCKFRGFVRQSKHKKYREHYVVSTTYFPINFNSIFNWLCKCYERGLKSYYDFEKKQTYNYQ